MTHNEKILLTRAGIGIAAFAMALVLGTGMQDLRARARENASLAVEIAALKSKAVPIEALRRDYTALQQAEEGVVADGPAKDLYEVSAMIPSLLGRWKVKGTRSSITGSNSHKVLELQATGSVQGLVGSLRDIEGLPGLRVLSYTIDSTKGVDQAEASWRIEYVPGN